jgi:2-methylcitrate dehydratase PrpD
VAASLGLASTSEFRFFRPATAGGFGAVAGLSVISGLDASRIADAFGLQYGQTSGTMQPHAEGNALLPMQIGFNGQSAVRSVDLARAGLNGPRDVFEGRYGYFPLFEGSWDLQPIWDGLGRDWRVCEMSHKPWPAGRATHGGIEGLLALREQHDFAAADVRRVRILVPPLTHRLVSRPDVPAPGAFYARLCMAFIGAKALLHGSVDIAHCRGEALTDAATHDLARSIEVEVDGNPDPNALAPQRVEIELRSGRTLDWACDVMLGNPGRPLSREQHLRKFSHCLEFARDVLPAPAGDTIIDLVDRLDQVEDVRELCTLLAPV